MTTYTAGTQTVPITDLVLDPALQCRVGIVDATVAEYADAMREGAAFPPVAAYLVDGELLVVDGWHRFHAAQAAGLDQVEVHVTEGNRREALLAAVQANARHGLQRTIEDKRRAVCLLLRDPEWAALSTRELGALAGVSHAYVGQLRRHYGLSKGAVLDDDTQARADGELPQVWRDIQGLAPDWRQADVAKLAAARTLAELASMSSRVGLLSASFVEAAQRLRLEELAQDRWPWPEDETAEARAGRVAQLDDQLQLAAAIQSEGIDGDARLAAFRAWVAADQISSASSLYGLEVLVPLVEGRPALEAAIAQRRAELKAEQAARPRPAWQRREDLLALEVDQAVEVLAQGDAELLDGLYFGSDADRRLVRAARRGREALGAEVRDCADPRCDGWAVVGEWQMCVCCRRHQGQLAEELHERLADYASLLEYEGYQATVGGEGHRAVVLDAQALTVLRTLQLLHRDDAELLAEHLPPVLMTAVRQWLGVPAEPPTRFSQTARSKRAARNVEHAL